MNVSHFLNQYASHPNYKSPVGFKLNTKSWQTEAPLRMLLNNLNSEVAEDPNNLVVYGGSGQAARNRKSLEKINPFILDTLRFSILIRGLLRVVCYVTIVII